MQRVLEEAVIAVRLRDSSSAWFEHLDETVTLVVHRRIPGSEGGWAHLQFHAETEVAAEAAYDHYCRQSYERARRQAQRRLRWGPT
jgi:hypothetical protein